MNRLLTLVALALMSSSTPLAHGEDLPYTGVPTRSGDLEASLSLLNLWGEQHEPVQEVFKAAFRVLDTSRTARFADVAQDPSFRQLCEAHRILHLGGPMLGCVTTDGVRVWVRTARPAEVEVEVEVGDELRTFGPVESSADTGLTAIVLISGLEPATRYVYRVLVDGVPIPMPEDAAMVTAPPDGTQGKVRLAFGSCFHRWGLGNMAQVTTLQQRQPAAMLLLGDMAVQDRNNHVGMHRADYLLRDTQPAWRRLAASIPVYATWDDHDYFDNDLAAIPKGFTAADRAAVWQVWRENWNNPSYGFGEAGGGVFLRTRVGPADILMVDHRYFRQKGSFLGEEQMGWLKEQLLDCKGPFIILSCGTMWSDYVGDGKDSWGRYDPGGRERLFSMIEEHQIGGVLLISGDRHGTRGFRIPRPSGFSFYEFEVASLGGRRGPPVTRPEWDTQLFGFANVYAFGEFDIDAMRDDPEIGFRLVQANGEILYELTLQRSQLTPGERERR